MRIMMYGITVTFISTFLITGSVEQHKQQQQKYKCKYKYDSYYHSLEPANVKYTFYPSSINDEMIHPLEL